MARLITFLIGNCNFTYLPILEKEILSCNITILLNSCKRDFFMVMGDLAKNNVDSR